MRYFEYRDHDGELSLYRTDDFVSRSEVWVPTRLRWFNVYKIRYPSIERTKEYLESNRKAYCIVRSSSFLDEEHILLEN